MTVSRRCRSILTFGFLMFLFAAAGAAGAEEPGEALREAARAGDLARVDALLAAGAPVDAPARYGQTPLYFAAENGHLAVARRLVERGANVNVQDRFFGASVLTMALGGGHSELARYLLAQGAEDAASALAAAIEGDDLELARAALATGLLEPLDLAAARRQAAEGAGPGLRDLLATASVKPRQRPPYKVAPERLSVYAGRYRRDAGQDAVVAIRGESLGIALPGQAETVLTAVAEDRFDSADGQLSVVFGGRGGTVEWARVNQGGDLSFFGVVSSEPAPLRSATPGAEGSARVQREAPRPWPQFRGPRASGIGDGQGAPATWDAATGAGVRFKTPIPGIGLSSPIVWGDRIFLTTAVSGKGDTTFRTGLYGDGASVDDVSEHSFRLYALDAVTGRVLWDREVHRGVPPVKRHLKSSLANATPATDGEHVVVLFGPVGKLAAYDFEGKQLWQRDIGILDCNDPQSGSLEWGHASSPILYGDLVLVQGDRRKDSFLAAYRVTSGAEVWRVPREEPSTWATPNILPAPSGDELIANGPTIRAYDPRSGKPLWSLGPSSEVVVATPVIGDGLAFVTAGYPPVRPVYAVRPGRRGDLSLPKGERASPAVAWSHARGGTYIPSPVLYRGILYTCNNNGVLTAYRAETGEQLSIIRLSAAGASFAASPVAADGRLYIASETGDVYILRAGPEPELLAVRPMGETVMATPAISGGLMVVRTLQHVFGLAEAAAPDSFIAAYAQEHNFNGSILVQKKGETLFAKSFGLANIPFKVPNTPQTKYKIASITKAFTAVLILQLYEQGKIDLSKPIRTYLPDYGGEGADKVTVHQLLNHTSGLANFDTVKDMETALKSGIPVYQTPYTSDQLLARFCSGNLVNVPGEVFDYNNGDYIVLGKIIERLEGKTYEQALRDRILQPLGMKDTGLLDQSQILEGLADTYFFRDDLKALVNDFPVYPENWYAAGAMYSTLQDVLTFSNALFGARLLQKETLALMFKPGLDDYGYGVWAYDTKVNGRTYRVVKRPGQIMGAQTQLYRFLDEDVTVILLSNTGTTDLDEFVAEIGKKVVG